MAHKIRVKFGEHEFEAEGEQSAVEAQFAKFIEMVGVQNLAAGAVGKQDQVKQSQAKHHRAAPAEVPLERVFRTGETVSLLALPKSDNPEADALLMLIFGFQRLQSEATVPSTWLMKAAKQSGIRVDRIDRYINAREEFFNVAGLRKGRRYSLNNRGIRHVEELLKGILE